MLSIEEALSKILADVVPVGVEEVSLAASHGRILAEDIVAPIRVPGFDNSAMDGYAVRSVDTSSGDCFLELLEVIPAGKAPAHSLVPGTAAAVMTGAPIPIGADAVVIIENTDGAQHGRVHVKKQARPGDNIRRAGQDIELASRVLERGSYLGPGAVGLAASLGLQQLLVSARPQVAILSTGDEVVAAGEPLRPGQIYSSNNHTLVGMTLESGCLPLDLGNVDDDLDSILVRLERALEADVVITTGGVSVGRFDFVKEAFVRLGVEMNFWKVAMKPGKPLAFGWAKRGTRRVPLFGLPGNPVSCMVNFVEFVRPYLWTSMGKSEAFARVVDAEAGHDFKVSPGRAKLERVRLSADSGVLRCFSTGNQSSGVLTSMAVADGLLFIPPTSHGFHAGEKVRVQVIASDWLNQSGPGFLE